MGIFKQKKIIKVEIIEQTTGLSEDDKLTNYAAGHMMGGFDGMVHAYLLNESESSKTTFYISYEDGSTEIRCVNDNSFEYNKYIKFI